MDGFLPGWEFQRGDILTSLEKRSYEMTADGKMRLPEETVIPEHPVGNVDELLAHLQRWLATLNQKWGEIQIARQARVNDEIVAGWTAKLLEETRRELRNARLALLAWDFDPKQLTFETNPADIYAARLQLASLIGGLTPTTVDRAVERAVRILRDWFGAGITSFTITRLFVELRAQFSEGNRPIPVWHLTCAVLETLVTEGLVSHEPHEPPQFDSRGRRINPDKIDEYRILGTIRQPWPATKTVAPGGYSNGMLDDEGTPSTDAKLAELEQRLLKAIEQQGTPTNETKEWGSMPLGSVQVNVLAGGEPNGKPTKGKRGRRKGSVASDPAFDQQVFERWAEGRGQFDSFKAVAISFGLNRDEAWAAKERHRDRLRGKSGKKGTPKGCQGQ